MIVGDVGYRDRTVFTAIGDAVNVAARLQDMTKALECDVLISDAVYAAAGLPADALTAHTIEIRGRDELVSARAS